MTLLDREDLINVHKQAMHTPGLVEGMDNLLIGLPPKYRSQLPSVSQNPSDRLLSQLDHMNEAGAIYNGENELVPLEIWLQNAAYRSELYETSRLLFSEYARLVAEKRKDAKLKLAVDSKSEKILFDDESLPFGFVSGALAAGNSVAKLTVTRYQGGNLVKPSYSAEPFRCYGTGWLIGSRHIITNAHVVQARLDNEPDASEEDLQLQACATTVLFDYNHMDDAGTAYKVKGLVAKNKKLDYAILELETDTHRLPLTLDAREFSPLKSVKHQSNIPLNIVQHPNGSPKKIALRANLAAVVKGDRIGYFTDTQGGSSGSPVCTDDWKVIALHCGWDDNLGIFEYGGKKTPTINIGTKIELIIQDLRQNHVELWNAINPIVFD